MRMPTVRRLCVGEQARRRARRRHDERVRPGEDPLREPKRGLREHAELATRSTGPGRSARAAGSCSCSSRGRSSRSHRAPRSRSRARRSNRSGRRRRRPHAGCRRPAGSCAGSARPTPRSAMRMASLVSPLKPLPTTYCSIEICAARLGLRGLRVVERSRARRSMQLLEVGALEQLADEVAARARASSVAISSARSNSASERA